MEKFFDEHSSISAATIEQRLRTVSGSCNWHYFIEHLRAIQTDTEPLRVAEVGCGSATFALSLALLGMSVTLIDADENALALARKVFSACHMPATFIHASVLDPVPSHLAGIFDGVISGGLAEHFVGRGRQTCLAFHRDLLKPGGSMCISVPNRYSAPYRIVRSFREITHTWDIETEIPYSWHELHALARTLHFVNVQTVGNRPLVKDLYDYGRGFLSALIDIAPANVRQRIRQRKKRERPTDAVSMVDVAAMTAYLTAKADTPHTHFCSRAYSMKNYFSAGISLFATCARPVDCCDNTRAA